MAGDYSLNYFIKGITLNKRYIINMMKGKVTHRYYAPNNIYPLKLSLGFLLQVIKYLFTLLANGFYRKTAISRIIVGKSSMQNGIITI